MSKASKRHILEDSDSDDDGSPTRDGNSSTIFFLTAEESQAIDKCNIQVGENQGRYSEESMSCAITRLGDMLQGTGGTPNRPHERYCVKKEKKDAFFDRDVYNVHGKNGEDYNSSPSEESILLEIEALRRSVKLVKAKMFRNKETGGEVIFGPWWNYAFKRLVELSSDTDIDKEPLGAYTAVMIIRSLFALMKDDLNDVVKPKPGRLEPLVKEFGVDWAKNVKVARRVINQCIPSHPLARELSAVEAHVEGLKSKDEPVFRAPPSQNNAKAASQVAGEPSKQFKINAKKQSNARKMRMAKMKANNLRRASSSIVETIASPLRVVASSSMGGVSKERGISISVEPRSGGSAPMQNSMERGQKPIPENCHGSRKPPPEKMTLTGDWRKPSSQPTCGVQFRANASDQLGDGWGRKRDGFVSADSFKTKGSWEFARRTLSSTIQAAPPFHARHNHDTPLARREMGSHVVFGSGSVAPDRTSNLARNNSYSSHNVRDDQGCSHEHDNRVDSSHSDCSSWNRGNRSGHFDSHPDNCFSDVGRDGGRCNQDSDRNSGNFSRSNSSDRGNYSRGDSRDHGNYSHDNSHSRSDCSRRDSHSGRHGVDNFRRLDSSTFRGNGGSSVYGHGLKHGRSQDHDDGLQKRFKGPQEMNAPTSSACAVAWMSSNGPTEISSYVSNNPGPGAHASVTASPASRMGMGRAKDNRPAWMTQCASSNGPTRIPLNNGPGASCTAAPDSISLAASQGTGKGNGCGADNRPVWTAQGEHLSNTGPAGTNNRSGPAAVLQHSHAASGNSHHAHNPLGPVGGLLNNGREREHVCGRGRGRGKTKTLPAWMTHPTT